MRKTFISLFICTFVLLFAYSLSFAIDKTLTALWEHDVPEDLAGFRLYWSDKSGGPYEQVGQDILYPQDVTREGSGEVVTLSKVLQLSIPSGTSKRYYFVVTAFDTSGNESGNSNQADIVLDVASPGEPTKFEIKILILEP